MLRATRLPLPTDAWARALLAPVLVFIATAIDRNYQTDLWHHLARGRALVEEGQLLNEDRFTYTVAGWQGPRYFRGVDETSTLYGEWRYPAQNGLHQVIPKNQVPTYAEDYSKLAVATVDVKMLRPPIGNSDILFYPGRLYRVDRSTMALQVPSQPLNRSGELVSIDRLNTDWGGAFWSEMYQNFDQIEIPNEQVLVADPSPHAVLDFRRWFAHEAANYLDLQASILRRYSEHQWITTNFMAMHEDVNPVLSRSSLDVFSWTHYPVHGNLNERELGYRLGSASVMSWIIPRAE